jgi:hypothetical protein
MSAPQDGNGHDALEQARLEQLPLLALRIRTAMAKAFETRGEIGGLYAQAGEHGYHRRALKEAIRLADMRPSKLRDYLTALNKYLEVLNAFAQEELLDPMPRPTAPPAPPPAAPKAPIATSLGLVAGAPSEQHRAQGRADGLQGFNETRNPWPEGSKAYLSWLEGWREGNTAMEAALDKPKRRSRRPPAPGLDPGGKPDDQPQPSA